MRNSRTDKSIFSQDWAEFVEFSDDARNAAILGRDTSNAAPAPNLYAAGDRSFPRFSLNCRPDSAVIRLEMTQGIFYG
jgi:hypothetical protein